jgi:2-polyprenyl-6-methoxyphenol hydroxylase-like FAD-dependent oxidoreductase
MTRLHIGVVGCGIAGMASAMYLARDGHAVTVFDRFAEPQPLGAGLLLQPTGQSVLRDLGLLETVVAGAARIDHLDSRNRQGRHVLDLPYALASHGSGLGVHRGRLFAAMWSGLQVQPMETCFGTAVSALEDGGRRIVLQDGRSFDFDLTVIAAGVHTPLRRYFIVARDETYPWGCLWDHRTAARRSSRPGPSAACRWGTYHDRTVAGRAGRGGSVLESAQ